MLEFGIGVNLSQNRLGPLDDKKLAGETRLHSKPLSMSAMGCYSNYPHQFVLVLQVDTGPG
jgi:hypothetical protein